MSYNEYLPCCENYKKHQLKNGPIDKPMKISNESYLIYECKALCKRHLEFPTKILIKICGKKEFYLGKLNYVKDYEDCNPKIFENPKHRPRHWIEMNKCYKGAKSVFSISNLEPIPEPPDLKGKDGPRRPRYRNFD